MPATPEWLRKRGGELKLGSDGGTWFALIGGQPLYSLTTTPVGAQHGPVIRQTNNGRRFESTGVFPSTDTAIEGGLEELRKTLGWE